MLSLRFLLLPLLFSLPLSSAQETTSDGNTFYTVWSSVIFTRTGDRTPVALTNVEPTLTALGAAQAQQAGAYMRARYQGEWSANGNGTARMPGLSLNNINNQQMFIGAPADQFAIGTAQAFMQGFYPPTNASVTLANASQITSLLMGGYQYPMIQTYGSNDPESIFLNAQSNCPAWDAAVNAYEISPSTTQMSADTESMYRAVGSMILDGVLPQEEWNYQWAWPIWDYVNYQNTYYSNVSELFSPDALWDSATNTSYLDLLRWYSDQQLNGWLGTTNAINPLTSTPFSAAQGSISTVAGNFLASQILGQLQQAIKYKSEYYKLSLLFGDFQPLTSLFNLLNLPGLYHEFNGMPDFASTVVFELWSATDGTNDVTFPDDETDLYVRFSFRNGTDDATLTPYGLFGLNPSEFSLPGVDLSWAEFSSLMYNLAPGNATNWCTQCQGNSVFCAYSNASLSLDAENYLASHRGPVSPVLAGVIGALVTLIVAATLFSIFMLFFGLRFHRVYSRKNSEIGGYKGSRKLASDKDLVIPKGGVAVVETEEAPPGGAVRGGHERVGSWELKQNQGPQSPPPMSFEGSGLPEYWQREEHDIGEAPWQKPVVPEERV